MRTTLVSILLSTAVLALATSAAAQTEAQLQYGNLAAPYSVGDSELVTTLTLQNATETTYGSFFGFVDFYRSRTQGGIYDGDVYAEASVASTGEKLLGRRVAFGPVKDIGPYLNLTYAKDAKSMKIMPGVELAFDVPGFVYTTLDLTRYIDASAGIAQGGAPKESDSWDANLAWLYPFKVAGRDFTFQGYAEYTTKRHDELGNRIPGSFLTQPQLRWEMNKHWGVGFEASYWTNKYGDSSTDEKAVQFLLVYKF